MKDWHQTFGAGREPIGRITSRRHPRHQSTSLERDKALAHHFGRDGWQASADLAETPSARLADAVPHSRLVVLEEAGHELNERDWNRIVKEVSAHTSGDMA